MKGARCMYCNGVGPRTPVPTGLAHKRCIPAGEQPVHVLPVPITPFKTELAQGSPWPFPISATQENA